MSSNSVKLFVAVLIGLPIGIILGSCSAPVVDRRYGASSQTMNEPRYLALGDSYTIGESVTATERWPAQLVTALRAGGMPISDPEIVARTGWTTEELAAAIDEAKPHGPYQLVTLLIGVNDQYRGGDAASYRPHFSSLLGRAIDFAGGDAGRVVVVSIPDYGVTPFAASHDRAAIARALDLFNEIGRQEAKRRGAHYVDITPLSRKAASMPALTAVDGLHPSAAMYEMWVREIEPVAAAAIRAAGSAGPH